MPNCFERVAIVKAKLIPLVYFMASRLCDLCDLCVSASLWRHVHHVHHASVQEEYGEATSSRFACTSTLQKCEKKGRCDAEDAADEIRRENGEKTTQLYLNSSFFIHHSSFFIYYNASPLHLNKLLGEHTSG